MNIYKKAGDQHDELKTLHDTLSGAERSTGGIKAVKRADDPVETAVAVDAQSIWMFNALRAAGWEEVPEREWRSDRWQEASDLRI